jgi:hypothetical protein
MSDLFEHPTAGVAGSTPQPSIPKSPLPNFNTIPFVTQSAISNNAQSPSPFVSSSKSYPTGSGLFGSALSSGHSGGLFGSSRSHRTSQRSPSPFFNSNQARQERMEDSSLDDTQTTKTPQADTNKEERAIAVPKRSSKGKGVVRVSDSSSQAQQQQSTSRESSTFSTSETSQSVRLVGAPQNNSSFGPPIPTGGLLPPNPLGPPGLPLGNPAPPGPPQTNSSFVPPLNSYSIGPPQNNSSFTAPQNSSSFGGVPKGRSSFPPFVPFEYRSPHIPPIFNYEPDTTSGILESFQIITALPNLKHVSLEVSACKSLFIAITLKILC